MYLTYPASVGALLLYCPPCMGAALLPIQSLGLPQRRSLRPLSAPVAPQRPTGDDGNCDDGPLPLICEVLQITLLTLLLRVARMAS